METIEILSDSELRTKLAEYGHPVGPVTETTRKILIKKLKLLMTQKKKTNKRFSSEESGSESEARAMPPPKLNVRKSTPRNKSLISSTLHDFTSVPLSSTLNNSNSSRVSRHGLTPRISSGRSSYSRAASRKNLSSSRSSYDFESGSDSDITSSSKSRLNSYRGSDLHLTYSPMGAHSRRTANVLAAQFNNEASKKESRPFFSSFTKRLTNRFGVSPQDIKESDAEDEPTTYPPRPYSAGFPSRPVYPPPTSVPFYKRFKHQLNSQTLSMLLLGVFILFFLWLGWAYFNVSQKSPLLIASKQNYYPVCKDYDKEQPGVNCIDKSELSLAVKLYKELHVELVSRSVQSVCGPVLEDGSIIVPYMTQQQVELFLTKQVDAKDMFRVGQGVNNLKLLLFANKHWGITMLRGNVEWSGSVLDETFDSHIVLPSNLQSDVLFVVLKPYISWSCYLYRMFYKAVFLFASFLFVSLVVYGIYLLAHNYIQSMEKESAEVLEMVDRILHYVSSYKERSVEANGSPSHMQTNDDFVAIRHVHDSLIHPAQRPKMASIWQKAVKFIEEHESRIRTELQTVYGEETSVWRWLGPPTSPNTSQSSTQDNHLYPDLSGLKVDSAKRVWQGEAFETCEGSINSLPCSPTQCLKIRHMFQLNKDYGSDWVVKVKDAIVEKCEGVKILHLSVDKDSREGCVYVKCASPQDAGRAYRQLHGSWFDGTLVTVKYLRLERYHERFPDSINATIPLQPSNNLRLSLQGQGVS